MKKQNIKTEKHWEISYFMKIMNTKTKEIQWLSLNGELQIIKIVPPREGLVLATIIPRIDSDSELEEYIKMFDMDFADLYLKVVESSYLKIAEH